MFFVRMLLKKTHIIILAKTLMVECTENNLWTMNLVLSAVHCLLFYPPPVLHHHTITSMRQKDKYPNIHGLHLMNHNSQKD